MLYFCWFFKILQALYFFISSSIQLTTNDVRHSQTSLYEMLWQRLNLFEQIGKIGKAVAGVSVHRGEL